MSAEALLVIDTQVWLLSSSHDHDGVVDRIAALTQQAREAGVDMVFVQHDGGADGPLAPGSDGWQIHPRLAPTFGDPVIHKRASDSFHETELDSLLRDRGVDRVYVVGCKTEYCVDTTSRRATTLGYDVTLVADCHTTTGNSVVSAEDVIRHHNLTLDEFGNDDHEITVLPAAEVRFG